jgi:transposase-like protein
MNVGIKLKARELLSQGYTPRDVCAACGIEASLLRKWAYRGKWVVVKTAEPEEYPPAMRTRAYALVDGGATISEVARALGVHRKTIYRWLESRPAMQWRCDCTPYGALVKGPQCPVCKRVGMT